MVELLFAAAIWLKSHSTSQLSNSRNPTPSDLAQILHTCLLAQDRYFWKLLDP